ncbi:hypothetical protein [Undibacterium parvum]|uniref:Uncharacterized protein n=2 Tax=Undibacterium TaxID=401469 RepID=A0A6M4A2N7_9BURK|nr:hypothetical protein [Undibacterium parvum]AZP10889.1 hypothetical protein EJN92_01950 [Undibacterium parvum]QJQ05465.1 hypothetical protein EJG51_005940 [Undibacterium piscinae]
MKIESQLSNILHAKNVSARGSVGNAEKTASFAAVLATKVPMVAGADELQSEEVIKKVENIDFSNMTPRDALNIVNKLVRSGQMTLDESSPLLGIIPSPMSKVKYDGLMPESFDQPCNFFEKLYAARDGALQRTETASAAHMQMGIDALMRFQDKSTGGKVRVNITC